MPWVEVQCPNEKCPAREVGHRADCVCKGTERVARDDGPGLIVCDAEEDVVAHRWQAFWFNSTLTRAGEWDASINCSGCGEEGEEVVD